MYVSQFFKCDHDTDLWFQRIFVLFAFGCLELNYKNNKERVWIVFCVFNHYEKRQKVTSRYYLGIPFYIVSIYTFGCISNHHCAFFFFFGR